MSVNVQDGRDVMDCSLDHWSRGECDPPRRGMLPKLARALGATVPPLSVIADAEPLPVRVDWGRLIADCPCGGAEMVWIEGPHIIWCARCGNVAQAGQWQPVALPDRLHEIILALEPRLYRKDRNWSPGEPVESLFAWNTANPDAVRGG